MPQLYVAASKELGKWGADVGISKHLYKLGIAEESAEDAVDALNESRHAGQADWKLVKKQTVDALSEETALERVQRREKLVDPNPTDLLDILNTGTNDFFKVALTAAGKTVSLSRTKIGAIAGSYWCQTSFIRRDKKDHDGNPVQYVLCLMNDNLGWIDKKDLIDPLDECILTRHP